LEKIVEVGLLKIKKGLSSIQRQNLNHPSLFSILNTSRYIAYLTSSHREKNRSLFGSPQTRAVLEIAKYIQSLPTFPFCAPIFAFLTAFPPPITACFSEAIHLSILHTEEEAEVVGGGEERMLIPAR
jgi:hypothetical protein